MKTVFLLNPKAGKGKGFDKIKNVVLEASKETGLDAGVYITKSIGDAEVFSRLAAAEAQRAGEKVRLIACGGDGTLNEVLNGIMGFESASVGVIPMGTGNDFVRNFPDKDRFKDVKGQILGETVKCDVIKYSGVIEGEEKSGYCVNMFNIGFDCNVVDLTARLKTYPALKGSLAYVAAVAGTLIKKKGADLKIDVDGKTVHEGPLLLTAIANGSFCGGGFKGVPKASVDDGFMDINVIYDITRREFIKKLPYYAKGTHMELSNVGDFLCYKKCRQVVITPLDGSMKLCIDGEIRNAGKVCMEIIPEAVNFIVP